MKHKRIAALTGGIASGKSTVSRMFQELGAYVIDADVVARQVVEPGQPAWKEIVEHFGPDILLENDHLNRSKLGTLVFANLEERQVLNRIVHPRVIADINQQEQQLHQTNENLVILVDVPLLIEAAMYTDYETVILVYVPEEVQLKRLVARDNISEDAARQRIASQMPLAEKIKYATYVVHNTNTLKETRRQVLSIYRALTR